MSSISAAMEASLPEKTAARQHESFGKTHAQKFPVKNYMSAKTCAPFCDVHITATRGPWFRCIPLVRWIASIRHDLLRYKERHGHALRDPSNPVLQAGDKTLRKRSSRKAECTMQATKQVSRQRGRVDVAATAEQSDRDSQKPRSHQLLPRPWDG